MCVWGGGESKISGYLNVVNISIINHLFRRNAYSVPNYEFILCSEFTC